MYFSIAGIKVRRGRRCNLETLLLLHLRIHNVITSTNCVQIFIWKKNSSSFCLILHVLPEIPGSLLVDYSL